MDFLAPGERLSRIVLVLCGVLLINTNLAAGEAVSPGQVQDTIQQQPPKAPISDEPTNLIQQPAYQPLSTPVGPMVRVLDFTLTGNTRFDTATLKAQLQPWIGREVTLDEIYAAADALTQFYHDHGYGLASVAVPAQKLSGGTIRLEVIEGRISAISISGNRDYSLGFLQQRFGHLKIGEIYQDREMERSVLLMNDLPGLTARAVIKPGAEYGTSDIMFVAQEDRYEYSVALDNYGREELGQVRLLADATLNNLGGYGDRLYAAIIYSEDGLLKYGNLSYGIPLSTNGARLRFTYNRADYEVGGDLFEALGITGDNTTMRIDYTQPLRRTRRNNVVFTAAAYRFETESVIPGLVLPNNTTELDLLELGIFNNGIQKNGNSWSASAMLTGNGKANESTATVPQSDAQQAKLRLDGQYNIPFARRWLFQARAAAVYSGDPLVDSQKFSLGGPYSVRGYFPAEVRGDEGAFLSLELRRYFVVKQYPIAVSVYVDGGMAKRELLPEEDPATDIESELGSAGVGLLFNPDGVDFSGSFLYAAPIDNHTSLNGDDDGHFWATVKYRF